jgi:DmsE family decaheme c-type cytochrome
MRALLLLFVAAISCGLPDLEPRRPTPPSGPPPDPATFAGPEVCAACHPDWNESYLKSAHAPALDDPARPPDQRACEACHGAGQAHVDGGGGAAGDLRTFDPSESAPARSAPCLRCHANESALHDFPGGEHAAADVACTDCHDPHGGVGRLMMKAGDALPEPLRGPTWREQETITAVCYRCHPAIRSAFAMPEHHKVPEGMVSCTDCHQPHGSDDRAMLRDGEQRTCFRCHGEVEGPFVYEHVGLTLEGCGSCHEPHGSANRHLLRYQQVAQLCYQCHASTPSSHVQPSYRDCTRCHTAIHGSNTQPHFLEP